MAGSFSVDRIRLKKILTVLKMNERSIDEILNSINKAHRHINAILFVSLLEKKGLKHDEVANILRRIGVDDVTITSVFNAMDEQRIKETYGKIVELVVD